MDFRKLFSRKPSGPSVELIEELATWTVSEILEAVEDGEITAADALAAELAGRNRKGVVSKLSAD